MGVGARRCRGGGDGRRAARVRGVRGSGDGSGGTAVASRVCGREWLTTMRIAFLANPESPGGWYRGIGPMVALSQRGHEIRQVIGLRDQFFAERVRGCDVLHVYREHDDRALQLMQYAKEASIAVVWDNDDNLAAVPKNNASYKEYGGAAGRKVQLAIKRIVGLADLVTAPSAMLVEHYRQLGAAHVELLENYVRDELLDVRKRPNGEEFVVGWLAGQEHHLDVERVPVRAALQRMLETHEHVRVVTIGAGLGLRSDRYRQIQQLDFTKLPSEMLSWDIGLAVIADIPFNHGRSNVKLKDYAVLGIPWLASPIGPYVDHGEKQGGRLVPDHGWYEAVERLVLKERERRKLAKRALRWGRAQTIGANVTRWERALSDAVDRAQRGDGVTAAC